MRYQRFRRSRWFVSLIGLSLSLVFATQTNAAELAEIRERGYLIVGVKDDLPPLGFRDASGDLQGLEIDLARWLAEQLLGDREAVSFTPLTNQERLTALLDNQVDLVIARLTVTASRMRVLDFSTPYYLDGTALVTNQNAIQTLSHLQQQPIAVLTGSDTIAVVRSVLPQAQLVAVESYDQARELLETSQVSAFAADATVLTGWVQQDSQYHLLPILLSLEALAVAMPRGLQYDDLRRQVNQAITSWQTEGMLRQQILQWGLPEVGIPGEAELNTIDFAE